MNRSLSLMISGASLLLPMSAAQAAVVVSENFGTLADGTALSSGNTSLLYFRGGTGGTAPVAKNPSTIGAGASSIFTGSTGTSLTGFGTSGLTAGDIVTLDITIKPSDATLGDFFLGGGTGTTFTGNGTFTGADLMYAIQSDNGVLQYRSGTSGSSAWTNFSPSVTLVTGTTDVFKIIANGSAASFSYTGGTVAAGAMDVYLNSALIGNDVDIVDAQDSTGFRLYGINGTATYESDSITLTNEVVPEPATFGLIGMAALGMLRRRRA